VRRDEIEDFGRILAGGAHLGQVGLIGNSAHGLALAICRLNVCLKG
jgi:hypothetical protein